MKARHPMQAPKYRKHKRGQAFVRIAGKDHYLGKYGSEASRVNYQKTLAKYWRPSGSQPRIDVTIAQLAELYLEHALTYYRESNEAENLELALRPLVFEFGDVLAREFRPKLLLAFRDREAVAGRTRQGINKQMGRIRRMFKWGVVEELIPADVLEAIAAVPPLARGRSVASESEPVKPVPDDDLEAVINHAPAIIGDMVQVQLLMGCRPGELVGMTRRQIDTSGDVWAYRPASHKNQWRDQNREIQIGPRAQEILRKYLPAELDAPIFSPRRFHRNAKFRESYDTRQYRKSIWSACDDAGIKHWSPNQLRHSRATEIRATYGVEGAQHLLGHATIDATQLYAERSRDQAREIAREIG